MAKHGFRVLDSDLHIIEPPDLWARYIDAPFKHRAPRGFADWVLDLRIEIDGKLMPADVTFSADPRARLERRGAARCHGRGGHRCRRDLSDAGALREGHRRDGSEAGGRDRS